MSTLSAPADRIEHDYPVHVEADLDPALSRGLWLVKWLLAIPHYVVLAFLWVAFAVLSVVAFFAILVTGHYPRAIFEFNVGVMRWSWRVSYYAYGALGTDRYPPFTLADVPDYPAHLEVDPPGQLSRGLVLVKWWLLAIPHYLVVGLFAGGLAYGVLGADDETWISVSLIGILVLVAAVVLLFTGRYPRGLFDLVLGLNRWVLRVAGYVALMTDRYPPFRLDQGGHEPQAHETSRVPPQPPAARAAAPRTSGWTAGRVTSVVLGAMLVLMGTVLAGAGGTLAVADATQREDGYLMSPGMALESSSFAITSQDARLSIGDAPSWLPDEIVGEVRIAAAADDRSTPVFVGIARTSDVEDYLSGVALDTLDEVRDGEATYRPSAGGAPTTPPADQAFWVAQAGGTDATLTWSVQDGEWSVVLMNEDGSAGVAAEVAAGAGLPVLSTVIAALFVLGGLALLAGALMVAVPVRAVATSQS